MTSLKRYATFTASILLLASSVYPVAAKTAPSAATGPTPTPPPPPALIAPADGASLVQPITLQWSAVNVPGGPIGSYTWQVGTTADFTTVVAEGFTNNRSDDFPTPTHDRVSGLPNATYFWRVKDSQITKIGGIDSDWSKVRTFTVTGPGAAPGTPVINTPATGVQVHASEFFDIKWSAVAGAQYYLLETDDEPTFSYPLALTINALTFGTQSTEGWGNEMDVYYRVRAVSADNVRSLPSATLVVHVTNAAPVPPAPALLAPAAGATVTLPFTFDWSDTPNPRFPDYELDVDTDPGFPGGFGVLFVPGISRSDYMLTPDLLAPGNYFWRIRAVHGQVPGPWSAGRAVTIATSLQAPFGLIDFIADPTTVFGGNPARARVRLDAPAPAGGALISLAGHLPEIDMPATVTIPPGRTDADVFPIPTSLLPGPGGVGTIVAADTHVSQLGSIGLGPILFGTGLSNESVIGGNSITATIVLNSPAPAGGATVRLISSESSLVTVPATVFIPAGGTDATVIIPTSAVSVATRVTIETGTDAGGFRAPQSSIVLRPPGTPEPAPSPSSLTLHQSSVLGGGTATATVTLTSPAPGSGAGVFLSGSVRGQSIVPQGGVTVPAGNLSANFTMTIPQVWTTEWPLIQAHYGISGGSQARVLEVDPDPAHPPTVDAFAPPSSDVFGGETFRRTASLVTGAPAGGGAVSLTSDNPSVVQVPATVIVPEGNSTHTFTGTTSAVAILTTVEIPATAGGITKSSFVNVAPAQGQPPLLQSLTLDPTTVPGGTNATGTVHLSSAAPSGGIFVTLSTNDPDTAQVPPIVSVPGGATSANFTVTTFPVPFNTVATISAFFADATQSDTLTVTPQSAPTPSATPVVTPTPGTTPTPTPTSTPAVTPTPTPVATPTPAATPTPGITPTATPAVTPTPTPATHAVTLSTRLLVGTGDNVGIGGFIITGTTPKHVLLRAIGPSLSKSGVPDALADPVLELHGPGSFVTILNDNWRDDPAQEALIIASGIPPTNNLESAIAVTLAPGAYTAIMSGKDNTSGNGLVEVYDLSQSGDSKLGNLSTRAFVSTGDSVVIAGFILGGSGNDGIVARGIGPSLAASGVPNVLPDPTLELRNSNGALLIANNDWQDDAAQAAELTAAGLAPTNELESGLTATLPPGLYTALLSGVNSSTGIGLVEVYDRGAP